MDGLGLPEFLLLLTVFIVVATTAVYSIRVFLRALKGNDAGNL